jgi:hypothetical protein
MLCNSCTSCHFSMSNFDSIGLEKELGVAPCLMDLPSFTFFFLLIWIPRFDHRLHCFYAKKINVLRAKMTIEKKGTHPKIGNLNFGQIPKLNIFEKWQVQKFNSYLLSINNKNQYLRIQYHTYKINLTQYHKIIKNGVTLPAKFQKRAYFPKFTWQVPKVHFQKPIVIFFPWYVVW